MRRSVTDLAIQDVYDSANLLHRDIENLRIPLVSGQIPDLEVGKGSVHRNVDQMLHDY